MIGRFRFSRKRQGAAGSVWLVCSDVPRQRTAWLGRYGRRGRKRHGGSGGVGLGRCGSGLEWEAGLDLVGSGGVRFGR